MLVRRIAYTDYNGDDQVDECMFNLSQAELAKMSLSQSGRLEDYIREMIRERDVERIGELADKLIRMSYGKKSIDGRRFIKSEELTTEFVQTEAYSELYMELMSDAEALANFIVGIVPAKMLPTDKSKEQLVKETLSQTNEELAK